ncbi:hypothetical protein GCM10027186_57720 [Micromonospora schwarzwaldensis]
MHQYHATAGHQPVQFLICLPSKVWEDIPGGGARGTDSRLHSKLRGVHVADPGEVPL